MMIPDSMYATLQTAAQAFMTDVVRFTTETAGASEFTVDRAEVYGPETAPHYGQASVTEDAAQIERAASGDETLAADALITLPLLDPNVSEQLLDSRCEAEFRAQTRTGRAEKVMRREVTLQLLVHWT